jgi:hypothetical protein
MVSRAKQQTVDQQGIISSDVRMNVIRIRCTYEERTILGSYETHRPNKPLPTVIDKLNNSIALLSWRRPARLGPGILAHLSRQLQGVTANSQSLHE